MNEDLELLQEALPATMFQQFLKEAIQSVEDELAAEDKGWLNLTLTGNEPVTEEARKLAVKQSRLYYYTDPMAKQAIRLWTDYSFGEGMSWSSEKENVKSVMGGFFDNPKNQTVLGSRGQRKSSDKLLVDGEIFFVLFLGAEGDTSIRTIDPLEITEIITLPDDIEAPMYYRRLWNDRQGQPHETIYRSTINEGDEGTLDAAGKAVKSSDKGVVYHFALNTLGQRGIPILLPAHFYFKYQRKFLAARISIMLAMTRFLWKQKVQGGATAVAATKAIQQAKAPAAGSTWVENPAINMEPIRQATGSGDAYNDGRMIKLQIAAATGWPEQYFGDLSTGNLATAKTVELPVQKMCGSYQRMWGDTYKDICEVVLKHENIPETEQYVDFDFPAIAPQDAIGFAQTVQALAAVFPAFANAKDVKTAALIAMGINDPSAVLGELDKIEKAKAKKKAEEPPQLPTGELPPGAQQPPKIVGQQPTVAPPEATAKLIGALKAYRESLISALGGDGHGQ